ncbi:hypothetical protein GGR44_000960 [Sphingobium fontiphilum]|uniref:Uncharacterized protein n=1 Tax=Sphingobium fontiphilum TaxID=944425 RepID=A0A7W6DK77_9SPHN|nr:hypothetical protein [Sphingobium fontiphilum]MBB3981313.1 hypothetical protein [Sphingobium fontiphilum]
MTKSDGKPSCACYHGDMEETVGSWQQEGRISLWRYRKAPKMYHGWHFTADQEGCASLIELFNILSSSTNPAHRTISLTDPQEVGADRIFGSHGFRLDVPAKLRIANDLDESGSIGLAANVFVMPLRSEDIGQFADAVRDISGDHADFGVSFGSNDIIINFWWWPNKR